MDILPLGADDLVTVTGFKSIFPKVALEEQEEIEAELNQKFAGKNATFGVSVRSEADMNGTITKERTIESLKLSDGDDDDNTSE